MDHSGKSSIQATVTWSLVGGCAVTYIVLLGAYVATFHPWTLPLEKEIQCNDFFVPGFLVAMLVLASAMLAAMLLDQIGVRFDGIDERVRRAFNYGLLFWVVFYVVNVVCWPRAGLRLETHGIEANSRGSWVIVSSQQADAIFRQNVRREIVILGSFVHVGLGVFISYCKRNRRGNVSVTSGAS